jgi:beta-phosphoglucomutase-like phosphatase (HAD superfamily)
MDQDTDHTPALLFDLDGTLIDSVYQHVLAWAPGKKGISTGKNYSIHGDNSVQR